MKIINIHTRIINQPKNKISKLFETLSSNEDKMLTINKWSPMKLDKGLQIGSKGGHGPIRYFVTKYKKGDFIQFQFTKSKGFNGVHEFIITEIENNKTLLTHSIKMNTNIQATFIWLFAIRWLHDAYIEDAFDRVENHFLDVKKKTRWSLWVKLLRKILKPRNSNK